MQEVLATSLLLTGIVLVLSVSVLVARRFLGTAGSVSVIVNDHDEFRFPAGQKLLWALAEAGIYLPATCGGKGVCGHCRVRIDRGCPPLIATEAEHITPGDAEDGFRLACMVRLREQMHISIDMDPLQFGRWDCEVVSNKNISIYLKELLLRLPENESIQFEAGDYIQLEVPPYRMSFDEIKIDEPYRDQWERLGLFNLESRLNEPAVRSYSPASPPQEDQEIRLVIRIALPPQSAQPGTPPGIVSSWLFNLKTGDHVAVRGPFGTFNASDSESEMVMIAGGAGIAPMRSIILDQLTRGTGRKISLWYGARNRQDLCYYSEFLALAQDHDNFTVHAVLSEPNVKDQWEGETGFVHAVVHDKYLKNHATPRQLEFYVCGPPVMASAVMQMLDSLGVGPENIYLDDFEL
jgi:Na+-transporting NADH:ubiquinone oxidoreductase subunit F